MLGEYRYLQMIFQWWRAAVAEERYLRTDDPGLLRAAIAEYVLLNTLYV